jgi:hypothetical protein
VWLCGVPSRKLALRVRPHSQKKHGGRRKVMGRIFLTNAFSLSMLGALPPEGLTVKVRPLTLGGTKEILAEGFTSAIGHEGTAKVLEALLGLSIGANRIAITLSKGDRAVVFQLGLRLQEGQVLSQDEVFALYEQGKASFYLVEVQG